eukprot:SAG31_NODE_1729_length_7427_cov_1.746725_4_plen_110_part_00
MNSMGPLGGYGDRSTPASQLNSAVRAVTADCHDCYADQLLDRPRHPRSPTTAAAAASQRANAHFGRQHPAVLFARGVVWLRSLGRAEAYLVPGFHVDRALELGLSASHK